MSRKTQREAGRRQSLKSSLELVRPDGTKLHLGSLTDQVYSFQTEDGWQYHWSVAEARKRAEAKGELMTISLGDTGMDVHILRRLYPGLDEQYALTTDLLEPLLFVPLDDKSVLIDGWHRTFKALVTGMDILPCYVLSEEDADASRILVLPPGKGLPLDIFGAVPDMAEKRY